MKKREAREKFTKADRLYREGAHGEALSILNELDAAFPNRKHILFPKARCFAKLYRADEAIEICDRLIDEYRYERARDLKHRVLKYGSTAGLPGADIDDMSFETLNIGLDDDEPSAFSQEPGDLELQPWARSWTSTAGITVAVIGVLVGGYFLLFRDGGAITSGGDSGGGGTGGAVALELDLGAEPEWKHYESHTEQPGLTTNVSTDYAIISDCGSDGAYLDCFLENYANCRPSIIHMKVLEGMAVQYEVLGMRLRKCEIEITFSEYVVYEDWQGLSMTCPCDPTMDFMKLVETVGPPEVMAGKKTECTGPLVDAIRKMVPRTE